MTHVRTALISLAAASAVALTGCSSGGQHDTHSSTAVGGASTGAAAAGPHNAADVAFATDMIPHHQQAVRMAAMALSTSRNVDVRRLATAIEKAQGPEIVAMTAWLASWGEPVPAATGSMSGSMGSMGSTGAMSGHDAHGMMTDAQMNRLSQATGTAFDRLWLTMMTAHHRGAVAMARTEVSDGSDPDAMRLARDVIATQQGEIATMASVLATL